MRRPQTIEGSVWYQQYFDALEKFTLTGRQDQEAVSTAVRALRFLLEREPGYALEVRLLTLQFVMGVYNAVRLTEIEALVKIGLDCESITPSVATHPAPSILLLLYLAEAQLLADQRLNGLQTLNRIGKRALNALNDPVINYARARESLIRAELNEVGRERDRARKQFSEAAALAAAILHNKESQRNFATQWVDATFGTMDGETIAQRPGLYKQGIQLVEQIYIGALLGAVRILPDVAEERVTVVREARHALLKHDFMKGSSPFFLIDFIGEMPPEEAEDFGQSLTNMVLSQRTRLFNEFDSTGISETVLASLERMFAQQNEAEAARDRNIWQVAMRLGLARARERNGDLSNAMQDYYDAVGIAIQGRMALPQAVAFGYYITFLTEHIPDQHEGMAEAFLITFGETIAAEPSVFHDAQYRALFDKAITALVETQLRAPDPLNEPLQRRKVSVLLDLLRSANLPPAGILYFEAVPTEENASNETFWELYNTLDRITESLKNRSEKVVALITHGGKDGPTFLILDGKPIRIAHIGNGFNVAINALEEAAQDAIFRAQSGVSGGTDKALENAGRTAFETLPTELQDAIRAAETVLIAADFRLNHDIIPFELLHDGKDFLLNAKVMSRFTSLWHLARTLDTRFPQPSRKRALIIAAPEVEDFPFLHSARPERDAVSDQLKREGFDVPLIEEKRLTTSFFVDRFSYVDALHIAAHGQSEAATEYIHLPNGHRMEVDDLKLKMQRSFPFVYLNTCQIGETRYLGGGQYRGMAYTLSELGSPAVLANTTDVLDTVSSDLARKFYTEAVTKPVGSALLGARKSLSPGEYSPALVARVIQLGNPWHSLTKADTGSIIDDPASDLLDAYFDNSDTSVREEARYIALERFLSGESTIRLNGAMDLLQCANVTPDEEGWLEAMDKAIAIADALNHGSAQALLRYSKAVLSLTSGESQAIEWLRQSIPYLKAREHFGGQWSNYLIDARARLRRVNLTARGLEFRRAGPSSDQPDEALDAVMNVLLGVQEGLEEEMGATRLRESEETLEDVIWNAVVIGHPNRFSDVREASEYAGQLAQKLVDQNQLSSSARPFGAPMLVGMLWWIWSSQNLAYLDPHLVEGHAGTLLELIKDIQTQWSPPDDQPWYSLIQSFPEQVDATLTYLDELPYETIYNEIDAKIAELTEMAKGLLTQIGEDFPDALPACAAYITGILAVKNTYSYTEGSVPEDLQVKLTDAVWTLNANNEGRFYPYLMRGFESVRNQAPDELTLWQWDRNG